MPFAKRGDVVHSEATSGFNNQKKSLLINGLAALGDSLRPLHIGFRQVVDLQAKKPTCEGWLFSVCSMSGRRWVRFGLNP